MSKKLSAIISLFSLFGLLLLIISVLSISETTLTQLMFWILLASLCESFPIHFSRDRVVSVTFAILLAVQLSHGTFVTTVVAVTASILYIIKNDDGTYKHTFNLPFYKTQMNLFIFAISAYIPGIVFDYLIIRFPFLASLPYFFVLIIIYISFVFLINTLSMTLFLKLIVGGPLIKIWITGSLWALPNYMAIAPIGFFIFRLYQLPSGFMYIFLLLGPLLLARYSFKLYLDSKEQYYKTIKTLTVAIEAKDEYTEGHSRRVEGYAERIAQRLKYTTGRIEAIKVAALLHDIGKIGIEDAILRNPGRLSSEEWQKIQQHPRIGMKILEEVSFPDQVKDAILHHHEKYDGSGYPDGLKGDQVSIDAYILAAADAYDAMTSDRPYRKALSKDVALDILEREKGTHFHPEIADIFISILLEDDKKKLDKKPEEHTEVSYAV